MTEFLGPLTILFIGNSLLTITLIFNQNESGKENNSSSSSNPFENATWFCFLFQLIFFFLKTKTTDF
jgi:hypothetical protein